MPPLQFCPSMILSIPRIPGIAVHFLPQKPMITIIIASVYGNASNVLFIPHSAIFLISSTLSTFFSKNYKSNYGKCGLGLSSDCVLHKRTVTLIRASRDGKKKRKSFLLVFHCLL